MHRVQQRNLADLCHVGHPCVSLWQAVQEAACRLQQNTGCVDVVVCEVIQERLQNQRALWWQ